MVSADSIGLSPETLAATVAESSPRQGPLYRRITRLLAQQIEQGVLPVGSILPSELELARRLGVSRHTMRAGLDGLVRAGLLVRQRGKGTIVLRPRIEQRLTGFYSVARELERQGVPLETRVLARGRLAVRDALGVEAAEHLGLADPQQVGYLWRLRLVDGEPLLLETITFPADLCLPLLQSRGAGSEDRGAAGFYDVLTDEANLVVTRVREMFRPVAVIGHEARLLGVADGAPIFAVERLGFVDDRPIEWRQSLVRGDRYAYVADLSYPAQDASQPAELRFSYPDTQFANGSGMAAWQVSGPSRAQPEGGAG